MSQNAIFTIFPYKLNGIWMFDDKSIGVEKEAFVSGADTMIEQLTLFAGINRPERGFTLQFSSKPFPDNMCALSYSKKELGGTWYRLRMNSNQNGSPATELRGWLCSVLNLYYPRSPRNLYVTVKPKRS